MSTDNTFPTLINRYISELGCTAKELANISGISETLLSRYRSGQRVPTEEQVAKLVKGIAALDETKQFEEEKVLKELMDVLPKPFPYDQFQARWSSCITKLHVNIAQMARYLHYDASYLSRITSGQRHPAHPEQFIANAAQFLARYYNTPAAKQFFASEMHVPLESIEYDNDYESLILKFLMTAVPETEKPIGDFLERLSRFDFDEYMREIHVEPYNFSNADILPPMTSRYYPMSDLFKAEKTFFNEVIRSETKGPLYIYNQLTFKENDLREEHIRLWSNGVGSLLARGMEIYVIHYMDRPIKEIVRSLNRWIPLYMTGMVHPFFSNQSSSTVMHSLIVTDAAAVYAEKIPSAEGRGTLLLTNDPKATEYHLSKARYLLTKARPIIEFFDQSHKLDFQEFLRIETSKPGIRRRIIEALPMHTLPRSVLERILDSNFIRGEEKERVLMEAGQFARSMEVLLKENQVYDEIRVLSKEEFEERPVRLFLPNSFVSRDIVYSYEDYLEHLDSTMKYQEEIPNYHVHVRNGVWFNNLQFTIKEGDWLIISKNSFPAMHIVFRHEKIRKAIETLLDERYDEGKKES